MDTRLQCR